MPFRACTVSFVEDGCRHVANVDAESAYEAAVLALKYFQHQRHIKGPHRHAILELEVSAPLRLKLKVSDVLAWLYKHPAATPAQRVRKQQLKNLLADDRH